MTLALHNISIIDINKKELFSSISFTIKPGEIFSLMGPSGCGKSTLLNMIAGHRQTDFLTTGDILLNGQVINTVTPDKRNIGILFQDDLLFPHLNIWQNLAIALPNSVKKTQRKLQVMETLEELNLANISEHSPTKISGGQRARIAMMRMLLAKPSAVLLDEPFSKLDITLRNEFRDWVFTEIKSRNIPALMVTHEHADLPRNGKVLHWPWNKKEITHA